MADQQLLPGAYYQPGMTTQQQIDEYNKSRLAPGSREAAEIDNSQRVGGPGVNNFNNPGSADFGGFNGGADWYSQDAKSHMGDNAGLVNSNNSALSQSLANMRGNRGPVAGENVDLNLREDASRNEQGQALDLMGQAAAGNAPSEAAIQTRGAMGGLMGTRASTMGGARGLSSLTGAQGGSSMGQAAGTLAAQGGQGRSQEIGQALGAYGGMAGQARGQDLNRLNQNSQNSMFNSNLNDAWKVGNANLAAAQGGLGNSLSGTNADWYKQSMLPTETQFAHDQQAQGWQAGANVDQASLQREAARQNNDLANSATEGLVGSTIGIVGSVAGGGMGGSKK